MRRINQAGLDLIKRAEGWRGTAYRCAAGVWTIGYGHTKGVFQGLTIDRDQGEALLREDLADAEHAVERLISVPLTDNQFAALVSFVFNIGGAAFGKSSLLRKLNGGEYASVPSELARWNKVKGVPNLGLTNRRRAEGDLWRAPQ